jgi:hypothetical protein
VICLAVSGALVTTSAGTPRVYAAALVLLGVAAVALVTLMARRHPSPAASPTIVEAGTPGDREDRPVPPDEEILRFARDVTRPASFDQLQLLIAQQLPPLLGVDRSWIVARFGGSATSSPWAR